MHAAHTPLCTNSARAEFSPSSTRKTGVLGRAGLRSGAFTAELGPAPPSRLRGSRRGKDPGNRQDTGQHRLLEAGEVGKPDRTADANG